jgi:hypothetical protein
MGHFISKQIFDERKLDFGETTRKDDNGWNVAEFPIVDEECNPITDEAGARYDGVIFDDGSVFDGFCKYDSAETFQKWRSGGHVKIAELWERYRRHSLYRDKTTGEVFQHSYHKQVSPSDSVWAVKDVSLLASWFVDLHEQEITTFPRTGHIVVSLPEELFGTIMTIASTEDRTERDWIVERLTECIQHERYAAARERWKEIAEFSARMKAERGSKPEVVSPPESVDMAEDPEYLAQQIKDALDSLR